MMWPFKRRCRHMTQWQSLDGKHNYWTDGGLPSAAEHGVIVRYVPCLCKIRKRGYYVAPERTTHKNVY